MVHCSVCGFPIVRGQCLHTALKKTADEWRAMSHEERELALKSAQQSVH